MKDHQSIVADTDSGRSRLNVRAAGFEANSRPVGLRVAMMTLRLLENWRTHLGVDHDSALIVLATAAITMEKFTRQEISVELRDIRSAMPLELLTKCNVSSIAAATGLNRETARRKVKALIEQGILIDEPKGSIRLSTDYTRRVRTSDMLGRQLQTLVHAANGLLQEEVLHVTAAERQRG